MRRKYKQQNFRKISKLQCVSKKKQKIKETNNNIIESSDLDELSPEEAIHISVENINSSLVNELIKRILKADPTFFENLIIRLLVAMGYSNNRDKNSEN